jgi:hypothetical protein
VETLVADPIYLVLAIDGRKSTGPDFLCLLLRRREDVVTLDLRSIL